MTEPRIKTRVWIAAQVRLCDIVQVPVAVVRRGDADSGQVVIKRNRLDGTFEVFVRTIALSGAAAWRCATGAEPADEEAADRVIGRESDIDPDIWVLEIEDPAGRYEFDAPVV